MLSAASQPLASVSSHVHSGQLPYPDRFEKAIKYVQVFEKLQDMSHDTQLMLYALSQQVVEGPASAAKTPGWGWSLVENAKLQAWRHLGNMSAMEAMRLYVRTLDEERPDWYAALLANESEAGTAHAAEGTGVEDPSQGAQPVLTDSEQRSVAAGKTDASVDGHTLRTAPSAGVPGASDGGVRPVPGSLLTGGVSSWEVVATGAAEAGGKRPYPRYEHGAAVVSGGLYVLGGNAAGRYLPDLWRLDLTTATWDLISANPQGSGDADASTPAATSAEPAADTPSPSSVSLGPVAGHSVTVWGEKLLVLGGHVKARTAAAAGPMSVRTVDLSGGGRLQVLSPDGDPPCARGGHTATLLGGVVWVFGGEDATRRPLDDLHCLDLGTLTWSQPLFKPPATPSRRRHATSASPPPVPWPAARSAHVAAAVDDRYLVLFGGGSATACHADVHVLDTRAEGGPAWLPARLTGHSVSPRAGHAGVVHDGVLYVVGGGNNVRGCTEFLAIDLRPLLSNPTATLAAAPQLPLEFTVHVIGVMQPRDPLSSEGASLVLVPSPPPAGETQGSTPPAVPHHPPLLLAYGGYNGKYLGTVSVLRTPSLPEPPAPTPSQAPQDPQAPVPVIRQDGIEVKVVAQGQARPSSAATAPTAATATNGTGAPHASKPSSQSLQSSEVEALRAEVAHLKAALAKSQAETDAAVKAAASAAAGDAHELALLRKQLATSQAALETASRGLDDARAALARESAKVLKLEAEAAEYLHRLGAAHEQLKEADALRRQLQEAEAAHKKASGGIWGYLAGTSS